MQTLRSLAILGIALCGPVVTPTLAAAGPAASPPTSAKAAPSSTASSGLQDKLAELRARLKELKEPALWVMKTGAGKVASGKVHKLCNTHSGECLGWKKQPAGTGINLSWFPERDDKQARLVKKGGGNILYGDNVALFVGQTDDSYLCYEKREFGINLTWSTKPCYQWRVDAPAGSGDKGKELRVGAPFVLFNVTMNDTMVRCARDTQLGQGAWLRWGKDCSTAELLYTNKSLIEQLVKEIRALEDAL